MDGEVERINMNKEYENKEIIDNADRMAKEIIDTKRTNHHRDKFFPMLIDKMDLKVGVEIGVDVGDFSKHILSKTKMDMYYCIDTWQDNFGSDCIKVSFDKDGNARMEQACNTLAEYINNKRAILLRGTSLEASKGFAEETIDFCYIDGDHSLFGIYEDLHAWVPKIRLGGICSGHDWKDGKKSGMKDYFGDQLDYKIKMVTENFCKKNGYALRTVGGSILSWYFIKNR